MKRIKIAVLGLFLLAGKAYAGNPSATNGGGIATPLSSVPSRKQAVDGNGVPYTEDHFVGYKVFSATATSAILVTDELGNAAKNGLLHAICASMSSAAQAESVVVMDSNTLSGATTQVTSLELAPPVQRSATLERCLTVDAQFNNGLVLLQAAAAASTETAHVYWRPGSGNN